MFADVRFVFVLLVASCHAQPREQQREDIVASFCKSTMPGLDPERSKSSLDQYGWSVVYEALSASSSDQFCWSRAGFIVALYSDDWPLILGLARSLAAGDRKGGHDMYLTRSLLIGWGWRVKLGLPDAEKALKYLLTYSSHRSAVRLVPNPDMRNVRMLVTQAVFGLALAGTPDAKERLETLTLTRGLEEQSGSTSMYLGVLDDAWALFASSSQDRR